MTHHSIKIRGAPQNNPKGLDPDTPLGEITVVRITLLNSEISKKARLPRHTLSRLKPLRQNVQDAQFLRLLLLVGAAVSVTCVSSAAM